jgi:hypothetical protein
MRLVRDDRGQFGGIEALPFGVLIFVVGALLVANAWAVIDAKLAATSAVDEAARTYVESHNPDRAYDEAKAAAAEAIRNYGRDPDHLDLPPPRITFGRCQEVTFDGTYIVPAITLPWIGGFGSGIRVHAHHTEIVDPFRNGVPGEAESCFS